MTATWVQTHYDHDTGRATVTLDPDDMPDWRVTVEVDPSDGVCSLLVAPRGDVPRGGLTRRHLNHDLRLRELELIARQEASDLLRTAAEPAAPAFADDLRFRSRAIRPGSRSGPKGMTPRDLAQWAVEYDELVNEQRCRTPIKVLAERSGYSTNHVRNLVENHLRGDYLTRGPAKRAGGQATPNARRLLESTED
jgi:hypothetical protein